VLANVLVQQDNAVFANDEISGLETFNPNL